MPRIRAPIRAWAPSWFAAAIRRRPWSTSTPPLTPWRDCSPGHPTRRSATVRGPLPSRGALLEADNTAPKPETAGMALAEVGRFEEAIDIQRTLVQEARRLERGGEERRLARNLERYERGEACCARVADVLPPY